MILVNSKRNLKVGWKMADYQKMYAVLCGAIDEVIPVLECVPQALPCVRALCTALEQAEALYIEADDTPLRLLPPKEAPENTAQA